MRRTPDRRSLLVFAVAVLALVVAGSTTAAYAAVAKNSVVSRSIKNGQVKTVDLADGAVASAKLRDGAVGSAKIADGSVAGADLGANAVGAQHLTLTSTYFGTSASTGDADGTTNGGDFGVVEASASCPAGWRPLSGGAEWVNPSSGTVATKNLDLHTSVVTTTGWYARGIIDTGAQGTVQLRARVQCLAPWPQPSN